MSAEASWATKSLSVNPYTLTCINVTKQDKDSTDTVKPVGNQCHFSSHPQYATEVSSSWYKFHIPFTHCGGIQQTIWASMLRLWAPLWLSHWSHDKGQNKSENDLCKGSYDVSIVGSRRASEKNSIRPLNNVITWDNEERVVWVQILMFYRDRKHSVYHTLITDPTSK